MAAFNFPDPILQQTVTNTITGSTYQWKEPPGKWVITTKVREVTDIIWEGDTPPDPVGDYKLWYSTDTLELYFYYTDANDTSAWVPTSAPITIPDPGVSTEVFTYTTGRLQTAIDENYAYNLTQDLLIEDLQAQIDELKGVTTTRAMLQYDRFGTKPASFSTNSVSLGSMSSIVFKGTTIQDEQLPSLQVGDTITLTGQSIGGRAILDITEVVDAPYHYRIQSRTNSNGLEEDSIYLVNFTEHN